MRREFLSNLTSSLGVVPFLAMSSPSSWGSLLFEPEGNLVPPKPLLPNPFQKNGKALVALIYGHDPNQMIREGIDVLGGIMKLGLNGKRVLIKPNVVNGRPLPSTTSLQVIAATTQVIREAGAIEITVADSSGVIRFPTSENLVKTGIRKVAENAGAKVLALEDEPWLRVEPKQAKFLSRYFVSKPVYEADSHRFDSCLARPMFSRAYTFPCLSAFHLYPDSVPIPFRISHFLSPRGGLWLTFWQTKGCYPFYCPL